MYGYAANGPAPPAYLLLAGPAYMSPSRSPNQGDTLRELLGMMGEVRGLTSSMKEDISEIRTNVSDLGERMAKAENANASTARSSVNGYRELARQVEDRFGSLVVRLGDLESRVKQTSDVAKAATLEVAPDVADAVAERVQEQAKPDRKDIKRNVWWAAGGVAVSAFIWPFINNVTAHPTFWKEIVGNLGQALGGLAKVMPTG